MEPLLTTILAGVVAGAAAKAKDISSEILGNAYDVLKQTLARKLGKDLLSKVELDPTSTSAQSELIDSLIKRNLQHDAELCQLAAEVERKVDAALPARAVGIEIGAVRARLSVLIEGLKASGRIQLGDLTAETGDVRIRNLTAGEDFRAQTARDSSKN